MGGKEFFDRIDALADEASVYIEAAREVSNKQFGMSVENPELTVQIAALMVRIAEERAARYLAVNVENGFSSIDNK